MARAPTQRFLIHDSPYGGFSLRARTVEAAWAKVEALLDAVAETRRYETLDLCVSEPCARVVAEAIHGRPLDENTAAGGPGDADVPGIVAATGHAFGPTAAAAVARFGTPPQAGFGCDHPRPEYPFDPIPLWAIWGWTSAPDTDPARAAAFLDFCAAHQEERLPCWSPHVVRLVRYVSFTARDGGLEGSAHAFLEGDASTFSLDLRWPTPEVDTAFVAFHDRVSAALGVKIPESRWKIGIIGPSGNLTLRKLGFSRKDWP